MNTQKGINFKQTPLKKLLLIHPATFANYLSTLPVSINGRIVFEFNLFKKLSNRHLFAELLPIQEDIHIENCRAINFIKKDKKKFVVIHCEMFNFFFQGREGWIPFNFKFLTNSETDFAEITPEKSQAAIRA